MFKRKAQEQNNEIGYEEGERRTPLLGYVLLIAMAIVTMWLGFLALSDLDNVPQKPEALSTCSYPYLQYEWQDVWHEHPMEYGYPSVYEYTPKPEDCVFSDIERKHEADRVFNESKDLRDEISDIEEELFPKESELNILKQNYQLGLTEDIAKVPGGGIYDTSKTAADIVPLEKEVTDLRASLNEKKELLKPYDDELKDIYKNVQADLRSEWRWHDFYSFLLQGIFVFPLFFFLLRAYFRLSKKNSPYLIIFTFLLMPVSVFILKIIAVYFWGLFLGKILEVIWNFIKEVELLRSLISYFGMIAAAAIFGGAVYFLQKKIFDPKRVALRHLRDKKCPNCSFDLELTKEFCSNCGHKILEKCDKCDKDRFVDLPVCQNCGDRKERE